MFYDFSAILRHFGLQAITIKNWPARAIDPETNRELPPGTLVQGEVEAVVFPVEGFSDSFGAQFLPQGVYEAGDMMAFVSGNAAVELHPAIADDPATRFVLTEGEHAVIREVPFKTSGNFRLFLLRKPER